MRFGDLIEKEKELVATGNRYGEHFQNCFDFVELTHSFVKGAKTEAWIFALFLSQIRKHIVLSFFSVLRLHHTQAMLDLRWVFEAGAKAAYSIDFPDKANFIQVGSDGAAFEPIGLKKKAYEWLSKNYPSHSLAMIQLKKTINESVAHASVIPAFENFDMGELVNQFKFSFFDKEDPHFIKVNLFFIGNAAKMLMHLFSAVNERRNIITFAKDFSTKLLELENKEHKLKAELKGVATL